jgi:hypothetical protein
MNISDAAVGQSTGVAINQRNRRKKLVSFLVGFWKFELKMQAKRIWQLLDGIPLSMVDAGGIEPPTCRLRVECSAS